MICHNLVTINQAGFRGLISFDKKPAAGLTHDVHWSEKPRCHANEIGSSSGCNNTRCTAAETEARMPGL